MLHMLKIGALAALTLGAAAVRAADPVVSARFSADSVMIGDQFSLDIRVDKDVMEVVDFPVFNGFLSDSADIEILAESPVDTPKEGGSLSARAICWPVSTRDATAWDASPCCGSIRT